MSTPLPVRRYVAALGGISLLAIASLTAASPATVAADPVPLARFETSNAQSREVIDYKVIDGVLGSLVIEAGNTTEVRYDAIKGDGVRIITQLVSGFATIDPTALNADEQLAYWLNLRMLMVMRSACQAYPATKPEGLLEAGSGFYTAKGAKIAGVDLSIADIDAIILKRAASNPNVVYGLVLPVREAPAFPRTAYRGDSVNTALATAARAFINRSGMIKADADGAKIPQFLVNHRDRLGGDDTAVLAHIRGLATPKLGQKLTTVTRLSADRRLSANAFAERSFDDRIAAGSLSAGNSGGGAAGS